MGTGLVNLRNDSLTHLVKYPKSLTAAATAVPLRLELSKRQGFSRANARKRTA